jgi:hypothetical protein
MLKLGLLGVQPVLCRLHVADQAVAIAVLIDVGREHDVFAEVFSLLVLEIGFALHQNGRAGKDRPAPAAFVLVPDINQPNPLLLADGRKPAGLPVVIVVRSVSPVSSPN